ncbi:MAG TPA: isocitrate/isopropylmalate dehydrogenase family protein [Candidatus Thalassarchaeaceae archaeon]|jgi:3-isopropylmalate dehydrogenase|nr:isocitrate/isopropylmalate dehydrogenase family protein [Candidatus Thalassarchaeaceae archaeon]|tara:strand:+ start:35258 stop:36445 length:1188 start_codon:yes stop_codon:yes gene_type:complete
MAAYRLTLLPGDGTGPEVIMEAKKVISAFQEFGPISFETTEIPCGGQHYLETGEEWPSGSFEHCRDESDAIVVGAVGWPGALLPNGDVAGGQVLLGLRSALDLYANVRPVKLYKGVNHKVHGNFRDVWEHDLVDMVMVRENTEGLYHALLRRSAIAAKGGEKDTPILIDNFPGLNGEVEWDVRPISRKGSERVIRFAFELAKRRMARLGSPQKITCVDKSNVTRGCRLFRQVFREISDENENVETNEAYIDAFSMWLVRNPEDLDVVVLPNMFGDIATDLASVLQGGMGMAASANIGDEHMLFEPVHGSSPKYAGKNKVNPIAAISSVQLMFETLGARHGDNDAQICADVLENAISKHLSSGAPVTYDLGGSASTSMVGDAIAEKCKEILQEMGS